MNIQAIKIMDTSNQIHYLPVSEIQRLKQDDLFEDKTTYMIVLKNHDTIIVDKNTYTKIHEKYFVVDDLLGFVDACIEHNLSSPVTMYLNGVPMNSKLDSIGLPSSVFNVLNKNGGFTYVHEIWNLNRTEILKIKSFGNKSLNILKETIENRFNKRLPNL